MAEKLNQILVVDVESTCWEKDDKAYEESEIIEIGVVIVNSQLAKRACKESLLVKPTKTKINAFCTSLTSITPKMVKDSGRSFTDACNLLQSHYRSKKFTWASWGDYDRRQFERQCKREGVKYPFGPSHINVKNLFALIKGLDRECGMVEALQRLETPLEGKHHRGVDDAWNIATILCKILNDARESL